RATWRSGGPSRTARAGSLRHAPGVARATAAKEQAMKAVIGALASAALFGLAARVQWPSQLAALVALAPWLAGVDRVRPRVALASAAVLAIGVMVSSFWWLPAAIAAYTHISLLFAWL